NGRHTRQMDMRLKLVRDEKPSDIIAATYPCTKYSTIADIHGARTGDELYLHFFRHLAIKSPECYVLENVPGMRKFPVVMEAMTKLPSYCPDSKAYRMIGNGVSVPLGRWVGKELVRYFNYSSSVQKTINSYRHGCRFN
ncbi:MAG TPA: DNA cytosine methyltransferase, partial [Verrucomicrobiae bacterium]